MKSIVNRVTLQQMKHNKKRTLITVIGIALSVAMLTATATVAASFLDMMRRNEIDTAGDWHVQYEAVSPAQLQTIHAHERTESVLLSRRLGYARFQASQDEHHPYLYIREYNAEGFQYFPVRIKEGRLPQRAGELVVMESAVQSGNILLGESLHLEIGQRCYDTPLEDGDPEGSVPSYSSYSLYHPEHIVPETVRDYTVVGVIYDPNFESSWDPGYTAIGYFEEGALGPEDTVTASVRVDSIGHSIYQDGEALAKEIKANVSFHNELLQYYGVLRGQDTTVTLMAFVGVILLVILIGSVALIYNAFAISLSERSRYMGMLASVGATRRQKRNSVLFEGMVLGALAIPIGIAAGTLGIGVTFRLLAAAVPSLSDIRLVVSPLSIGISILLAILTILISAWRPARRASKIAPIDAIRQSQDIKIDKKAVKTGRLTRRLFGMEGELALKNLKRNRKRYNTMIFSLVISILLFLTASYGTNTLAQTLESENRADTCDAKVTFQTKESVGFQLTALRESNDYADHETWNQKIEQEQTETLLSLSHTEGVTDYAIYQELSFDAIIAQDSLTPELSSAMQTLSEPEIRVPCQQGDRAFSVYVTALNEDAFAQYCKQLGLNAASFADPSHYQGILYNHIYTTYIPEVKEGEELTAKRLDTALLHVSPGDSLTLGGNYFSYDTSSQLPEPVTFGSFEIAAATDQPPLGGQQGGMDLLQFYVPEGMLEHMAQAYQLAPENSYLALNLAGDTTALRNAADTLNQNLQYSEISINDLKANREESEQLVLVIRTFAYGFIALLSAISIANVFNTISTSVALRRREFAMLRSVGMTLGGLRRMLSLESLFYGLKALLYGLPLGILVILLLYAILHEILESAFQIPWLSLLAVVAAVFLVVGLTMLYSNRKTKGETIVDAMREENI